jgi:hypothetical protein
MAPIITTAEYKLLTTLRDGVDVSVEKLNKLALSAALAAGYADLDGSQDFAHITDAGYDRLDEIEDGK